MLSFGYPWLLLLLPLPWLLRAAAPPRRVTRAAVQTPFGDRLEAALGRVGGAPTHTSGGRDLLANSLLWLLVLAALARPQWIEPPVTKDLPTRDLLLLVDLSGSMQQEDFTDKAGKKVDRLTAVKQVLGDFLVRRQGDRVGLVVFGDAPYLQAPFSTDLQLDRRLLDECEVGMAGPRTTLGDAIGLGVNLFDQSEAPAKTIIALTDGNDTKSRVPPVEAARVASQRDITVYTVAIGDPTTAGEDKLDVQTLKDVAAAADGEYFFAADRDGLEGIYDQLDKIETRKVQTVSHRPRSELYYWPLAAALLLSLAIRALAAVRQRAAGPHPDPRGVVYVNALTGRLELAE